VADDVPLASIDGDVVADARYTFTGNAIAYALTVHHPAGALGGATFTGTFTTTPVGASFGVTATYTTASVTDQNGAPVSVTSGTCSKYGNCDAFVFGDNNPLPEPCACKTQQKIFTPAGATQLRTDVYGEDTTFHAAP
jgi:hypothetical protein